MGARPAYIKQTLSASCWAACMEALGGLTFRVASHQQIWYVTQWGVGFPSGGLDYNSSAFDKFCNAFGFSKVIVPAGGLTEAQVLRWLAPGSDYFIFIEQQNPTTSHARLAYAWRSTDFGAGIEVMDPDPRTGGNKKIIFPVDLNQVAVLHW